MNNLYFFIFLVPFAICKTYQSAQQLPLPTYEPEWKYKQSYYQPPNQQFNLLYNPSNIQPSKSDNENEANLNRQFQQHWQIAIPNQQQGSVVWTSARQYGYYPPPPHQYPTSLPQPADFYPSTGLYPNQNPPSQGQQTVLRDQVQTTTKEPNFESASSESSSYNTIITTITDSGPIFTIEPSNLNPTSSTFQSTMKQPSNFTGSSTSQLESSTKPSNAASNPLLKYCQKLRGQFPSNNCSTYINCWDDFAIEQSCPPSLLFNVEKLFCDYPENTNCSTIGNGTSSNNSSSSNPTSSSPSSLSTTTSSSNNSSTYKPNLKCPDQNGVHRNTSNCAAFYVCVFGEAVDFICGPGTVYNDELKICDYPSKVNCQGSPIIENLEDNSILIDSESSTNTSQNSSSTSQTLNTYSLMEPSTRPPSPSFSEPVSYASPPPAVDPIAVYNNNLQKLPESVVNTGVRCYHTNILKLTSDCSSVTVCQEGLTYIINCAQATSFDAYSQKCVPTFKARC